MATVKKRKLKSDPWSRLNSVLRVASEQGVLQLLRKELGHLPAPRKSYLRRIHERLNWLRFTRERQELGINTKGEKHAK